MQAGIIKRIQQTDRPYYRLYTRKDGTIQKIPFGHLESMAIENKYGKISGIKDDDAHRYAVTGQFTVDLKAMRAYLTSDPDNKEEHYDVERGATFKRDTRSDPSVKFATNIAAESLKEGNSGFNNWVAY